MIQNFDEETHFQTLFYLDRCILKENFCSFFNKNNSNIPKFFLYFIKENRIDYDNLFIAIVLGCFSIASKIYFFYI